MERLTFIGTIHSSLKRLEDCPLQERENAPEAIAEIYPEFVEGLSRLNPGDDIILLTWLHMADRSVLSTRPRNDPKAPMTGVFATRSPHRPNPIGMHIAKVVSVENNMLKVSGLEVLDGTPLVDIKVAL